MAQQPTLPSSPAVAGGGVTLHARGQGVDELLHVPAGAARVLGSVRGEADYKVRDPQISRRHVELTVLADGGLLVRRLAEALNRVYLLGPDRVFHDQHLDPFRVGPGQTFAIGSTYFTVQEAGASATPADPQPTMSVSISPREAREELLASSDHRLRAAQMLLERLTQATTAEAMLREAVQVLRANLHTSQRVAVVRLDGDRVAVVTESGSPHVHLSARLVTESLQTANAVFYEWQPMAAPATSVSVVSQPTWGACLGLGQRGLCLYVGGGLAGSRQVGTEWQGVLRFLEFVGGLLRTALQSLGHRLRQERTQGFLPRRIRDRVLGRPEEEWEAWFAPRVCDLTVMFCDIVGFCQLAADQADDPLPFWEVIREALSVMTERIHDDGGVVIDFQGDAVLAVWGWPRADDDARRRQAAQAAHAALRIQQQFSDPALQRKMGELRAGTALRCGVALASGPGVVGFLGNDELGGIDAFGHAVNRAARVQALTRRFQTPILTDQATADLLLPDPPAWCRVGALLRVALTGLRGSPELVHEVQSAEVGHDVRGHFDPAAWPELRRLFEAGAWDRLRGPLGEVADPVGFRRFVRDFLAHHDYAPPADWNGIFAQGRGA